MVNQPPQTSPLRRAFLRLLDARTPWPGVPFSLVLARDDAGPSEKTGVAMSKGSNSSSFEAEFIERQWEELRLSHPPLGQLIDDLWAAVDVSRACVVDQRQLKNMVGALGRSLRNHSPDNVRRFKGWMTQFVRDGALPADKAAALVARVEALNA